MCLFAAITLCSVHQVAAQSSDSAARQLLVKTLLSEGSEQQTNLAELADTGSKLVHDVLTAWTRDGVYIIETNDAKIRSGTQICRRRSHFR
jgi:hypothetical protein